MNRENWWAVAARVTGEWPRSGESSGGGNQAPGGPAVPVVSVLAPVLVPLYPVHVARCTSPNCQARVIWREHQETGKRAPIDPEPHPQGNVTLDDQGRYKVLTKVELAELDGLFAPPDPPQRYMPHWATCADPEHFKRCGQCHRSPCECAKVPA